MAYAREEEGLIEATIALRVEGLGLVVERDGGLISD